MGPVLFFWRVGRGKRARAVIPPTLEKGEGGEEGGEGGREGGGEGGGWMQLC